VLLRVIIDGPRHPWYNMAMDEAILLSRRKIGLDTLRIYKWSPPAVSLGRGQSADTVDLEEMERAGIVLVRRPTGGGALLHLWEITYSVVLSSDSPLVKLDVGESARTIAQGVARAVELLGATASVKGDHSVGTDNICYMRSGSSDVMIGGRKISGSAQVRNGDLLQHGTLLLHFDPELWIKVIRSPGLNAEDLRKRVTSLDQLMKEVREEEIVNAIVKGFTEVLGEEIEFGEPTKAEVALTQELMRTKYSTDAWNLRSTSS